MTTFLDLLGSSSLTRVVAFPLLACLPLVLVRTVADRLVKTWVLLASIAELGLVAAYVARHLATDGTFPAVADPVIPWLPGLGISYHLEIDGISLPLVALTALLMPLVVLGSWTGIDRHWRGYAVSLLLLESGMLGALLALDLFLFYVFWELMLVPMYMIIGIWGGERRIYAAVKFFLFTMAGSLPLLLAILWMASGHAELTGRWSFAYADLATIGFPLQQQGWLFAAFAVAFAVKVPMVPLHTWLPDAHVEAPTGGSVILAGVLLKMGTYGFLRFALPFFPHATSAARPLLVGLALAGIVYGALVAWVQPDAKKLVAYSSVAHLGYVMLGILAVDLVAWQGALLQMVNHGLSTGALFLLVGMIYERRHSKKLADFGGLAKPMPWFAFLLAFSALASVGLPMLNGFVGEFLILVGTFRSAAADLRIAALVGAFGVVLAAVYLLHLLHRTLWGPVTHEENRELPDLSLREILTLAPLCLLMLGIGLAPQPFLRPSAPALAATLRTVEQRLAEAPPEDAPVLRVDTLGGPGRDAAGARR